ncbi:MAG: TRAP transporter small permease [Alphaproteobacteria bacterium]|nr:TRAP transporter small permease [Alphaproteobacteria bacterium]MBV9863166.1 TRAP transporter small permease [Alphaproteobacteria bacterium]
MTGWFDAAEALIRRCENVAMVVACIAFVAMVLTTASDVLLRYAFNSPLIWAYPVVVNYLIVILYFGAVSAAQRHGNHIGIELLTSRLPPRLKSLCAAFSAAAMLALCGLIAWCGVGVFWDSWVQNEVLSGVIAWPRWPSYLMVPLGFGLLSLRLLLQIARHVAAAIGLVAPLPLRAEVPVGVE